MTELEQFKSWLKLNKQHFLEGGYTPDEVAWFAINDSFDPQMVHQVLSHFHDALNGSSIDRRAALQVSLEVMAINGALDLTDQWRCLGKKLLYDRDFGE